MMDQTVFFNIVFSHRQRVSGNIHRIDFGFREGIGAGNGNTAAAGTHIEDMLRLLINKARKAVIDKLANR